MGDLTNKDVVRMPEQCQAACKRVICDRCKLCSFHCSCRKSKRNQNGANATITMPKTPVMRRQNHELVLDKIRLQAKALLPTPAKIKSPVAIEDCTSDNGSTSNCSYDATGYDFDDDIDQCIATNCCEIKTFDQLMEAFPIPYTRRKNFPSLQY